MRKELLICDKCQKVMGESLTTFASQVKGMVYLNVELENEVIPQGREAIGTPQNRKTFEVCKPCALELLK